MAVATVGTSVVELVFGRGKIPVIQNLHATNNLYFGDDPDITTADGIQLAPGIAWNSPMPLTSSKVIYVIADAAATDVRFDGF